MKVLFLGGTFDANIEKDILAKSKGGIQYAANKFQWNLIESLSEINNVDLQVLSAPFIGAFPHHYKDIYFKKSEVIYKNNIECSYVAFNNIWGYKNISRKKMLIRRIKKFLLIKEERKKIIVYSPHTPFLQAAVYAKKKDPSIHICLIVPDLPQFMNLNENRTMIYNFLKKIDIEIFNKNLKSVDSFVLLTEYMKDRLNVGNRPYIVVEGVVNEKHDHIEEENKSKKSNILLYSGTLNHKFGITNLVKAFHMSKNSKMRLLICGSGDSEEIVRKYALLDKRIEFLGQLTNKEVIKLQKSAAALINPRQNNEEFTKYSFPSKNMEYLLSGRPVIAYKLDGIPDQYDEFFFYVKDNSLESLMKKIEDVMNLSEEERFLIGKRGREFVLSEKNSYIASKRIIELIQKERLIYV